MKSFARVSFGSAFGLTAGLWLQRLALTSVVLAVLFVSGCLSRHAGPSLPYVQPATTVPDTGSGSVHLAARIEELDMEIQRLRDMVERSQAAGGDQQQIRKLQERLAFVEKQLGIEAAERPSPAPPVAQDVRPPAPPALGIPEGPRDDRQAPAPNIGAAGGGGMMPANAPVEIRDAPLPDEERAYRDAHAAFRNGDNDRALQLFDEFVKKYPKNRFAASAIYWIGEARFAQGNYEEAVLQFDRVIKEYAGSNKHVSALLKQGQAFEKMGDVRSARIIFQKIVKEHPHTAQARIAGGRLKALPPDVSWNYSTPY